MRVFNELLMVSPVKDLLVSFLINILDQASCCQDHVRQFGQKDQDHNHDDDQNPDDGAHLAPPWSLGTHALGRALLGVGVHQHPASHVLEPLAPADAQLLGPLIHLREQLIGQPERDHRLCHTASVCMTLIGADTRPSRGPE